MDVIPLVQRPPPFCSLKNESSRALSREVTDLCNHAKEIERGLSGISVLWSELFVVNRVVYKFTGPWRRSKILHGLKKVRKNLTSFYRQEVQKLVQGILSAFNQQLLEKTLKSVYLPSKQYCEFLLVQLVALHVVLRHCVQSCEYTHAKILQMLTLGSYGNSCLVIGATISRIWTMVRSLIMHLSTLYGKLFTVAGLVAAGSTRWLPDGVVLPEPASLAVYTEGIADGQSGRASTQHVDEGDDWRKTPVATSTPSRSRASRAARNISGGVDATVDTAASRSSMQRSVTDENDNPATKSGLDFSGAPNGDDCSGKWGLADVEDLGRPIRRPASSSSTAEEISFSSPAAMFSHSLEATDKSVMPPLSFVASETPPAALRSMSAAKGRKVGDLIQSALSVAKLQKIVKQLGRYSSDSDFSAAAKSSAATKAVLSKLRRLAKAGPDERDRALARARKLASSVLRRVLTAGSTPCVVDRV